MRERGSERDREKESERDRERGSERDRERGKKRVREIEREGEIAHHSTVQFSTVHDRRALDSTAQHSRSTY